MDCQNCNGMGHTAIIGDNDLECVECNGTGEYTPAPVIVTMGSYCAKVEQRNALYHLSLNFFDTSETLTNAFCNYHHAVIAMGRALVMACRDGAPTKYIGWNYEMGTITFTGWITFRGRQFDVLPDTFTSGSGFELGTALIQLGAMMQMRRQVGVWLNQTATPASKAG